ncbi:MAG: EamA family transporter [Flavobacteriales bacterium]|nr:MAG: EamA family transporter [Flavobacteriales bacterium]
MKFFDLNKKLWQWVILLFLAFIWGSSFILMKKGLEVYSHSIVAALRLSIAFVVLVPFAITSFKNIEIKYWKYLIFTGVIGNGIPAFLFTLAQTQVASSLSGMLNSLTPIFALMIGVILFNTRPLKSQIIGISIGLLGAAGLIFSNGLNFEKSNIFYIFLIVVATFCYALSVNVIKAHLKEINSLLITSLSFISIGPFTIIYLFTTDFIEISLNNPFSNTALFYIVILSVLGTVLAIILFNMLIKKTSTLFATSVTYLIPIVAIFWGLLDGEKINIFHIISVIITFVGIYFINKFR